jgi:hypothetical protein
MYLTGLIGNQEVAANIAATEIHHGQEVDLVNAASALEEAKTEDEKRAATQTLSDLLKQRQTTYVRWSLDRHVTKIRVIPRDILARKPRAEFEKKNSQGNTIVDWRAYGAHVSMIPVSFRKALLPYLRPSIMGEY